VPPPDRSTGCFRIVHAALSIALVLLHARSAVAAEFGAASLGNLIPKIRFHDNRVPAGHLSGGETYDYQWVPARPGLLRLEVRNDGRLMTEQRVTVR